MTAPRFRHMPAALALADHEALRALVAEIDEASAETGGAADAVRPRLAALRDRLRAHFDGEEKPGGFFDQVLEEAPERVHECEALREQHGGLLRRIDELRAADAGPPAQPGWGYGVRAVLDELARHEARENELLTRILDRSIQAQD